MGLLSKFFAVKPIQEKRFPPIPSWRPDTPVDLDNILRMGKNYTGEKLQLAIFKYGTVVLFPERVVNIEDEAKLFLNRIYNAHADFKPLEMEDGNYLIQYTQPAFTIVFKEEIENLWGYIEENHMNGVCTDEVLINGNGEQNVFDQIGKICLYGRSKMFMDALEPVVAKTFEPFSTQ